MLALAGSHAQRRQPHDCGPAPELNEHPSATRAGPARRAASNDSSRMAQVSVILVLLSHKKVDRPYLFFKNAYHRFCPQQQADGPRAKLRGTLSRVKNGLARDFSHVTDELTAVCSGRRGDASTTVGEVASAIGAGRRQAGTLRARAAAVDRRRPRPVCQCPP